MPLFFLLFKNVVWYFFDKHPLMFFTQFGLKVICYTIQKNALIMPSNYSPAKMPKI